MTAVDLLLGAMVLLASSVVLGVRPIYLAIVVLGVCFVNPAILPTMEYGDVSIRLIDIATGLLSVAVIIRILITSRALSSAGFNSIVLPWVPFLGWAGASLLWSLQHADDARALVSFVRLLATAWVSFLVFHAAETRRDVQRFISALVAFAIVCVAIAGAEAVGVLRVIPDRLLVDRYCGIMSYGSLGLVSGLLLVYASVRWDRRHQVLPILVASIGVLGLFLSRSGSSVIATAAAVVVATRVVPTPLRRLLKMVRGNALVALCTAGVLGAVGMYLLRPDDVQGLLEVSSGSFAHRLMLGFAGTLLFLRAPLAGVGWQASANPAAFDLATSETLLATFPHLPLAYFPMQTEFTLHNFYIQVLAELGIIGVGLLCWGLMRSGRRALIVMAFDRQAGVRWQFESHFIAFGLTAILVWWNTNPLFGGQTETLLAFGLLGLMARCTDIALARRRRAQGAVANQLAPRPRVGVQGEVPHSMPQPSEAGLGEVLVSGT